MTTPQETGRTQHGPKNGCHHQDGCDRMPSREHFHHGEGCRTGHCQMDTMKHGQGCRSGMHSHHGEGCRTGHCQMDAMKHGQGCRSEMHSHHGEDCHTGRCQMDAMKHGQGCRSEMHSHHGEGCRAGRREETQLQPISRELLLQQREFLAGQLAEVDRQLSQYPEDEIPAEADEPQLETQPQ